MTPLCQTRNFRIHSISQARDPRMQDLLDRLSRKHHVGVRSLLEKNKAPRLVAARHELWWLCARELSMTSAEIAGHFNYERSTISHAIANYQQGVQDAAQK